MVIVLVVVSRDVRQGDAIQQYIVPISARGFPGFPFWGVSAGPHPNNVPCISKAVLWITDPADSCAPDADVECAVRERDDLSPCSEACHITAAASGVSDDFSLHLIYPIDLFIDQVRAHPNFSNRTRRRGPLLCYPRTACDKQSFYRAFTASGSFRAQPPSRRGLLAMLRCGLCYSWCYSAFGCACACLPSV
jgi:hypothetical protein